MKDPYTLSGFIHSVADDEGWSDEDQADLEEVALVLQRCGDLLRRSAGSLLPFNPVVESHVAWRPRPVVLLTPEEAEWLRAVTEGGKDG